MGEVSLEINQVYEEWQRRYGLCGATCHHAYARKALNACQPVSPCVMSERYGTNDTVDHQAGIFG